MPRPEKEEEDDDYFALDLSLKPVNSKVIVENGIKYTIYTHKYLFKGMDKYLVISTKKQLKQSDIKSFGKKLFMISIDSSVLQKNIPKTPNSVHALQIDLDSNPTGKFSSTLKELRLYCPNSQELPDFSYTNIENLNIEECDKVKSLDGSRLPKTLQDFRMIGGKISKFPENLPVSLDYMILAENKITTLPDVSYLKNLQALSLNTNKISKILPQKDIVNFDLILYRNPIQKKNIPKQFKKVSM